MGKCLQCGSNIAENSSICQQCGYKSNVKKTSIPPAPVVKKSPPPPILPKQDLASAAQSFETAPTNSNQSKLILVGFIFLILVAAGVYYFKNVFSVNYSNEKTNEAITESSPTPIKPNANSTAQIKSNNSEGSLIEDSSANQDKPPAESNPITADNYLNAALAFDWVHVETLLNTTVVPNISKGNRKAARKLNEQAIAELRKGNQAGAIQLLNQALIEDPSDMEVRNNLGFAQIKSGDLANAKKTYLETLLYVPTRAITWGNLAEVYAEENKADLARAALRMEIYLATDQNKVIGILQKITVSDKPEVRESKLSKIIATELSKLAEVPARD